MKHLSVFLAILLFAAPTLAGDDASAVAVAKAKARVKAACDCDPCTCPAGTCRCTNCPCKPEKGCRVASDYERAQAEARRRGQPLAVFVGQPATPMDGWVTCRCDNLADTPAECVLVKRGGAIWLIHGRPSREEIAQVGAPLTIPRATSPMMPALPIMGFGRGGGGGGGC